jgi:hypothetical protein
MKKPIKFLWAAIMHGYRVTLTEFRFPLQHGLWVVLSSHGWGEPGTLILGAFLKPEIPFGDDYD